MLGSAFPGTTLGKSYDVVIEISLLQFQAIKLFAFHLPRFADLDVIQSTPLMFLIERYRALLHFKGKSISWSRVECMDVGEFDTKKITFRSDKNKQNSSSF